MDESAYAAMPSLHPHAIVEHTRSDSDPLAAVVAPPRSRSTEELNCRRTEAAPSVSAMLLTGE